MRFKKIVIEIITAFFVLLWVYAATSKLLDFETFKIQLGKSPLLTDFSGFVAIVIPLSELLFAVMLLIKRFVLTGLYLSLFLMVMFTTYLIAMLEFSNYVPCSCGGILSNMSWNTHILFNLVFVMLAFVGIVLVNSKQKVNGKIIYQPSIKIE